MIDIGQFSCIGEAWLVVAKHIMQMGNEVIENGEEYKEWKGVSFSIACTTEEDYIINKFADVSNIQWMKNNFENMQR